MIPNTIVQYLATKGVPYVPHHHDRAVSAQQVAHSIHVTGHRMAKVVIADVDDQRWIAVLPASLQVDDHDLAQALGGKRARFVREEEFAGAFPDCERGAEPPFGTLYGLPVVVERELAKEDRIVFRAGSHEDTVEMAYADYAALERPRLATFGWR